MEKFSSDDSCVVLCLAAQSCPTLCNPMDCSPSGSSIHGHSPGKNTGVGCHALCMSMNPGLQHCRRILYCLSHQRKPVHALVNINFCLYLKERGLWFNFILATNFYKLISFLTHLCHLLIKNLHWLFYSKEITGFQSPYDTVPYSTFNRTMTLTDMASILSYNSLSFPCLPSLTYHVLSFIHFHFAYSNPFIWKSISILSVLH